ncbi:Glycosyltransferase [Candidatus Sulfopaludibacter sp. SbA4]|nr:Glycosyltransferase [Candidatus Sulfopaludibacter sp. SbA4]
MIEGNDIICFSNDWDGDPLSKKHIVSRLAQKNRVLWVNSTGNRNPTASVRDLRRAWRKLRQYFAGCRPVAENISVFSPLVIPFHGNRAARWMNRRLLRWSLRRACRKLGFQKPITWTFVPSSADVAGSLGERLVIYHCVDEFSKFTGTDETAILEMEHGLMEKADMVVVSSSRLFETKHRYNPNTFLVTHGVDVAHFKTACLPATAPPADCANLPRPVIGFFGLIADWVDLEVVRYLAASRPQWSLLLIGEIQTDTSALRELPNVHLLGRRSYQSLPAYCRAFDVAILPFVINELTVAANPLKLREYLAAGLPVVATPLPEVLKLNGLVRTALTPAEFLNQIEALLSEGKRGPDPAVSRLMERESWDHKVEELSGIVTGLNAGGRSRGRPQPAGRVA